MFQSYRNAYRAGYRAGHAGADHRANPFNTKRAPLLAHCYDNGWQAGVIERLNKWLAEQAARQPGGAVLPFPQQKTLVVTMCNIKK